MKRDHLAQRWGVRLCVVVTLVWLSTFIASYETSLTILTIIGLVLSLYGFRDPAAGLLGVGLVVSLDSVARTVLLTGGLLRFNTFNYVLLAMTIAFLPQLVSALETSTRWMLGFIALLSIQLLISPEQELGIQQLLNVVSIIGLLLCFRRAGTDAHLWTWLAILMNLTSAVGSLVYFLDGPKVEVNPNAWALMPLAGIFSASLAFPIARSPRLKTVLLALSAVNLIWVLASASRGALVVALIQVLYLVSMVPGWKGKFVTVIGCVAGTALFAMAFPGLRDYAEHRISMLVDPERSVSNRTSGRSEIAKAGWEMFREHPFGVGTGGFSTEFARLDRGDALYASKEKQAHSGWVKVLAENGVIGMALLAGYVVSFSRAGTTRTSRKLRWLGYVTTMCLVTSLLSVEFQSKGLWLLTAGTTVILNRRKSSAESLRDLRRTSLLTA